MYTSRKLSFFLPNISTTNCGPHQWHSTQRRNTAAIYIFSFTIRWLWRLWVTSNVAPTSVWSQSHPTTWRYLWVCSLVNIHMDICVHLLDTDCSCVQWCCQDVVVRLFWIAKIPGTHKSTFVHPFSSKTSTNVYYNASWVYCEYVHNYVYKEFVIVSMLWIAGSKSRQDRVRTAEQNQSCLRSILHFPNLDRQYSGTS